MSVRTSSDILAASLAAVRARSVCSLTRVRAASSAASVSVSSVIGIPLVLASTVATRRIR
ncbi:hypothetical protein [Microbacterium caowuchunii]|uniref:hypothetical protein n=1 Tax=Microbacterium caowuchunii TaxID=2614638 RepID=UPI001EE7CA3A|nr:hypothetical protein [Microbacterium caowuchunii]